MLLTALPTRFLALRRRTHAHTHRLACAFASLSTSIDCGSVLVIRCTPPIHVCRQDGSFFGSYPTYHGFYDLVRREIKYNARRLAAHPSLCVYSGNNEGSVFGDVTLYVDTQLATMHAENTNVRVYPSCPSNGWQSLSPLVPRSGYGTFRLNFHHFHRFELDLRGHTRARGCCPLLPSLLEWPIWW